MRCNCPLDKELRIALTRGADRKLAERVGPTWLNARVARSYVGTTRVGPLAWLAEPKLALVFWHALAKAGGESGSLGARFPERQCLQRFPAHLSQPQ